MLESILRDIRFARRSLLRTPVLTFAAILSIGLGIAATTAVFSIVNAALFRLPPFERADRLIMLYSERHAPNSPPARERWSWQRSRMLRERAGSFEQIATFSPSVLALTSGETDPEPITADLVSASYWPLLRARPVIGRAFGPEVDEGRAEHPEIIVGYDLWQRRFGGEAAILGRTVDVNGVPLRVIGVAPQGFVGITGNAQAWIPATMAPALSYGDYLVTNQNFICAVGRLKDGITLDRARAELDLVGAGIMTLLPPATSNPAVRYGVATMPLADARIDPATRRPMWLLLAAAACLLLLACANVAGLLLGRAVSRQREIAIRVATGASRGRIVRQLLIESGLLGLAGGVLGVLVAIPAAKQLMLPAAAARSRNMYGAVGEFAMPGVDYRVLAFCVVVCALTAIAFGLFPSLRATRVDLTRDLKEGSPSGGNGRVTSRQLIVGLETALAVLLLFSGGLLMSGWRRMTDAEVGFDRSNLMTFLVRPSDVAYPAPKAPALIERVLTEIEALPGVEAATVDGCFPVGTGCANTTLFVMGRPQPARDAAPPVLRHYVGPNHFATLRVPLIRGRYFNAGDRAGANRVAIINDLAAERFWPDEDPIGKRVWFGGGSTFNSPDSSAEIVGIVGNVAYQQLDEHPFQPDFYTPYAQFTYATRMVLVRTTGNPLALANDVRRAVRRADPNLALFDVKTMEDRMADSWSRLTYQIRLLTAFALAAVLLAGMGIFAVIAHVVSDRRREIGVRVALGATPAQVIATVGDRGARPAMIGLIAGVAASTIAGRFMAASVYGVRALDPLVVAAVVATTLVVIVSASYLAARRALAIEPAESLRAS
jgi:predicted permease